MHAGVAPVNQILSQRFRDEAAAPLVLISRTSGVTSNRLQIGTQTEVIQQEKMTAEGSGERRVLVYMHTCISL